MGTYIESELVEELWDAVKDSIPPAKREDAALRFLKVFENDGGDLDDLVLEEPVLYEAQQLLLDSSFGDEDEDEIEEL